jgi:hypothetical protein
VEWKVGPDPEENVIQETSSLHAFAGLNASSVLEVTTSLSAAPTRIIELETELKTQKDNISAEFLKAIEQKDKLHKEEIEKTVQVVRDELTSEFERATRVVDNIKTKELNKRIANPEG